KIKELILSVRLENTLTKDQILELYLNEIFLGQNSYGVTAAAQTYYNKTLNELTVEEAAYLAALPQRPGNLHPVRQREDAIDRRNFVLREMAENGYITRAAMNVAQDQPLLSVQAGDFAAFREKLPPRDYFTDEIRRQLSREMGEGQFFGGGLSVRATYAPDMQVEAAAALRRGLERYDRSQGEWRGTGEAVSTDLLGNEGNWRPALREADVPRDIDGWNLAVVLQTSDSAARVGIEGVGDDDDGHWIPAAELDWISGTDSPAAVLSPGDVVYVSRPAGQEGWKLHQIPEIQGAFMAMDVNTGRVIAMQGGFSYQQSSFNRATQATRQPGSSFKPFVFAAALDSGFTPATILIDAPIEVELPGGEIWRPRNASNQFYGPTPLRTGIE
ncbi:MAG: transglycosylase domain-containing protein, partial [Pseudomonadota bacterium]